MKPLVLVCVTLCLFAAGCDDSKNPLSDPKTAKIDQRLAGVCACGTQTTWSTITSVELARREVAAGRAAGRGGRAQ